MLPAAMNWEALVRVPAPLRCDVGPRRSGGVRTGECAPTRGPSAGRSLGTWLQTAVGVCG
jgi:hypothetical protein